MTHRLTAPARPAQPATIALSLCKVPALPEVVALMGCASQLKAQATLEQPFSVTLEAVNSSGSVPLSASL
jgi:hypothetical protein